MIIDVKLEGEHKQYIESCAHIRNISITRMIQRLVDKICDDQLALAVLDDNSQPVREKYAHHFRHIDDEEVG